MGDGGRRLDTLGAMGVRCYRSEVVAGIRRAADNAGFGQLQSNSVIERLDPADLPIVVLSVSSPQLGPVELTTLTEKVIKRRLEGIEGVGSLTIVGGQRREIQVYIDPQRMKAYGLTVPDIVLALRRGNMEVPAGKVYNEVMEELVRIEGKLVDPELFQDLIVKNIGGVPVYLH